jgi:hypothetical protein
MVDIQPQTVLTGTIGDDKPWMEAVDRGFNQSITLDLSKFTDTDILTPVEAGRNRFIKSGVPLKKSASGGTYEPATDADDYDGLLFDSIEVVSGSTRSSAALFTHGTVRDAFIPGGLPTGDGPALIQHITA